MSPHTDTDTDDQSSASDAMQYHIRAMTSVDISTVVQIDQATWSDRAWRIEHYYDSLDDPLIDCWILESKTTPDQILGYGIQRLVDGIAHVMYLCLDPDQCGRGLGGILLRHMIDYARWLTLPIVELQVKTSNTRAYKLYVKHGFVIADFLEQYYSETEDAYLMRLTLIE